MCRDKDHGGRRCPHDTSQARLARRHRARAAANSAGKNAAAAVAASQAHQPTPTAATPESESGNGSGLGRRVSAETLRNEAEALRAKVAEAEANYDYNKIADKATMERFGALEAESSALGARVNEWIESQEPVARARERFEDDLARLDSVNRDIEAATDELHQAHKDWRAASPGSEAEDEARARLGEVRGRYNEAVRAREQFEERVADSAAALGDARLAEFSKLREMGGEIEVQDHFGGRASKRVQTAMNDTARFFPSDWVRASNELGERVPLMARASTARAHYATGGDRNDRDGFVIGEMKRRWKPAEAFPSWEDRTEFAGTGMFHGRFKPGQGVGGFPNARQVAGGEYEAVVEFARPGCERTIPASWDAYKAQNRRGSARRGEGRTYEVVDSEGNLTEFGRADGWTATTLPDGTKGAVRDYFRFDTVAADRGGTLTATFSHDRATNTSIHETTHRMEHAHPKLGLMERAYLTRRAGQDPREAKLANIYSSGKEKALPGAGMYTDYCAKVYSTNDGAWEVSSTGTPLVWGRMSRSEVQRGKMLDSFSYRETGGMKDEEHRSFVYGTMLTI